MTVELRPVRAVLRGFLVPSSRTLDRQHDPGCALWLGFGADRPHANFDPLIGLNNAFGDMLLNFVMAAAMFIVLPGLWVTALGWSRVRAGGMLQGLANGTRGRRANGWQRDRIY